MVAWAVSASLISDHFQACAHAEVTKTCEDGVCDRLEV